MARPKNMTVTKAKLREIVKSEGTAHVLINTPSEIVRSKRARYILDELQELRREFLDLLGFHRLDSI